VPNIATILKEEILRLARKEIRRQTNMLRKASAQYRKEIAEMKRRELSAADYGKLIGVKGQTIYSWERETSRPRKQQAARIASLRHMGKTEAQARLEQRAGRSRKNSPPTETTAFRASCHTLSLVE
jgi:DNA-binding XRE family transcriptional regulator